MGEDSIEEEKLKSKNIDQISKIISAINPDLYSELKGNELRKFKKLTETDFWKAVEDAEPTSDEEHILVYDSSSETLEPVYFWLLDLIQGRGNEVKKIIDNFTSSPGSGHFSELMGKATAMQKEAMNIMQTIGILVKNIINLIYDLREFQIILSSYKKLNSKDEEEKKAARLSLKQRWMDSVDIKRGNTSIKAMAAQFQFVTLIDAFMVADSLEGIKNMDLNDRVKRILEARLQEYLEWEKRSEKELSKRYNIQRIYLKSQVDSLKMYTRWAKPYLRAASQLEQKEMSSPELVTAFNTIVLQLVLFTRKKIKFDEAVTDKLLPEAFRGKKPKRDYSSCVLVDFHFRGIPQRAGQHYVFGGRATVNFKAYALNKEEYEKLIEKLDDSDINEALKLASGMTDESLNQIREDLEEFLNEKEEDEEKKKSSGDIDPFTALFKSEKKKEDKNKKDKKIRKIKPDNYTEKLVRILASKGAKRECFKLFDIYKKAHGMPSYPDPYDEIFVPTED